MQNDSAVTLPVAFFWIIKQSSLAVTTTNHNLVQFRMPYTSHHTLSRHYKGNNPKIRHVHYTCNIICFLFSVKKKTLNYSDICSFPFTDCRGLTDSATVISDTVSNDSLSRKRSFPSPSFFTEVPVSTILSLGLKMQSVL